LQCTEEPGEIEGYPRFEKAFDIAQRYNTAPVERLVTVNDQQDFEYLGDLVKAVNAAFLSAWKGEILKHSGIVVLVKTIM